MTSNSLQCDVAITGLFSATLPLAWLLQPRPRIARVPDPRGPVVAASWQGFESGVWH